MDQVVDFVRLSYVRNDLFRELFDIVVHILFYVFKRKSDRSLHLWKELLRLLHLRDGELEFRGGHDAFLSHQFLSLFLGDHLLGQLFRVTI